MCAEQLEQELIKYCQARVAGQVVITEIEVNDKEVKFVYKDPLTGFNKLFHTLSGTDIGTVCNDFLCNHFAPGYGKVRSI